MRERVSDLLVALVRLHDLVKYEDMFTVFIHTEMPMDVLTVLVIEADILVLT